MFKDVRRVCFVDLEKIVDAVNHEFDTIGTDKYYQPEDWVYLFWCEQEFGSDCFLMIDISAWNLEEQRSWIADNSDGEDAENDPDLNFEKFKLWVMEYLRKNLPEDVDRVFCQMQY